jgi:hypothetical protein
MLCVPFINPARTIRPGRCAGTTPTRSTVGKTLSSATIVRIDPTSEMLTKLRARNIFYDGSLFFIVVFVTMTMTIYSHNCVVKVSTARMPLSPEARLDKHVWECHRCINCHTLHGEVRISRRNSAM